MRSTMTIVSLLLVLAVAPMRAVAQQVPDVPAVPTLPRDPEIINYRLTMQKVRQVIEVQRHLNALGESNPALIQQIERDSEGNEERPSLKEGSAQLEKYPALRAVFARSGTTALDFFAAAAALGNAWFAIEIKEGRLNPMAAPPPETAAEKANVALLESNRSEWLKLRDEFMQLLENSPFNP